MSKKINVYDGLPYVNLDTHSRPVSLLDKIGVGFCIAIIALSSMAVVYGVFGIIYAIYFF